jgi:hypothetical protein
MENEMNIKSITVGLLISVAAVTNASADVVYT